MPRENRLNTNIDDLFLSTKMIALNEHLGHLKDGDKVVVFSQFLGMMDLLENEFRKSGFNYVVLCELRRGWKEATATNREPRSCMLSKTTPKFKYFLFLSRRREWA